MEVEVLTQMQLVIALSNQVRAFNSIILEPTLPIGSSYMPLPQSVLPEIGTVKQELVVHD